MTLTICQRDCSRLYQQEYAMQDIGSVLFALANFDDADPERMPRMLWNTDWKTIKKTIRDWLKNVAG